MLTSEGTAQGLVYRKREATKRVLLHASHTPPSQSNLKEFLAVNGRKLGLLTVGYHYLILRDGQTLATRPNDTVGTHCRHLNHESIGVCLAGGLSEETYPEFPEDMLRAQRFVRIPQDNFTPAQWDALRDLTDYLGLLYGPLPLEGHTEAKPRRGAQCPPTDMEKVRAWLTSSADRPAHS